MTPPLSNASRGIKNEKQTLLKILKNGGVTLDARGKAVEYAGGYQVSFIDLNIIDLKNIDAILDLPHLRRRLIYLSPHLYRRLVNLSPPAYV